MATEFDQIQQYAAFISYRHVDLDRKWAKWLIKRLETYRAPKKLIKKGIPQRIGTLFRDDDEIPASSDLSGQIEQALEGSEFLIVICSPETPKSKWVREEIETFRRLGKGDRILALLVDGEPEDSFPPEMLRVRHVTDRADGTTEETWEDVEPIASDVRPRSDEKQSVTERRALIRIAATLLGCRFDDLMQRDRQRRRRRQVQWASVGLISAGLLGSISLQLISERQSASLLDRDTRLASIANLLGSGNAATAFEELQALSDDFPGDAAVTDVVDAVLAWAKTPTETVAKFSGPLLYSDGRSHLSFKSASGSAIDVGPTSPARRIGFDDDRMVLIYSDRIVLLDTKAGRILDELDAEDGIGLLGYRWTGHAFQAPDGTTLIAGHHQGISNSQIWHAFLTFSRQDGTLSVIVPIDHPARKDAWSSRYMQQIRLGSKCRTIGVPDSRMSGEDLERSDSYYLLKLDNGLQFAGTGSVSGGADVVILGDLLSSRPPFGAHFVRRDSLRESLNL